MSSTLLVVVVVGLSVFVAAHNDVGDRVRPPRSRAAARRLLRLSHDVARSLSALNFRLPDARPPAAGAACYVVEQVPDDVTIGDVTETGAWSRRLINIPLQLTEYRRTPRNSLPDLVS